MDFHKSYKPILNLKKNKRPVRKSIKKVNKIKMIFINVL